jgi:hypothetical protein
MLKALLEALPNRLEPFSLPRREVDEALARLDSSWTVESLARDPYWPKWDSPWWTMVLLHELDLSAEIPQPALAQLIRAVDAHYAHVFRTEPDSMHGLCLCGLGTLYQLFAAAGIDVDAELPWARGWFVSNQLTDGGYNCDGDNLTRSSMVSTVPMLEALLKISDPTEAELEALDRGASYLLERRLAHSLSKGGVIDPDWLIPIFPRFYEYDVLRGLQFVTAWALKRQLPLQLSDLQQTLVALTERLERQGQLRLGRSFALEADTLFELTPGHWEAGFPATTFPLLEAVSRAGETSPYLTRAWLETAERLRQLDRSGLIR